MHENTDTKTICGIDYSLTSPALCIHQGNEWSYDNCVFHFFAHKEKGLMPDDDLQFKTALYPSYDSDPERYDNLSRWAMNAIRNAGVHEAFIEGYSYNSVGRVFQIAENGGLIKHSLWKADIPCQNLSPPQVKKFATGKGNSAKPAMFDSFFHETGVDLFERIGVTNRNNWTPVSDIVDAYFVAKAGFFNHGNSK